MKRALLLAFAVACSNSTPATSTSTTKPGTTPTATPDPAEPVQMAQGKVSTHKFSSKALGVDKEYVIWLPAGYDGSTTRWPVFYYLHGLGGNETNWTNAGKIHEAANVLSLGAIIVMPDGDDGFYANGLGKVDYDKCIADGTGLFSPTQQPKLKTCVRQRNYETYITEDLVREIDGKYRTIATREGRAIAGLSMGGFGALNLGMRHPDLYAAAASHSGIDALLYAGPYPYEKGKVETLKDPKLWGAGVGEIGRWVRGIFGEDLAHWREYDPASLVDKLQPDKPALYLDCGTEDVFMLHNGMQYLHDLLVAKKIDHAYFIGPGQHDFTFWVKRVPESLKFLSEHTTAAK